MNGKVLIVEDDPSERLLLKKQLTRWGYEPREAADASTGEKIASEEDITAAILDYKLPDFDGVELFRRIIRLKPGTPVMLITGAHKPELTIQAMSEGLYHYMSKPVDMDELKIHLDRAITMKQMTDDYVRVTENKAGEWFIGSSRGMLDVFRRIGLFANTDSPVLICGETGTGKELAARALHRYSARRERKFITLHISSLSSNLVESELFGHEKGSFTGADRLHVGRIEAAAGGCLFIDELADMPPDVQAKLLRVLEYGDYSRVGGEEQLQSEARLIIATNVDPRKLVDEGTLREDLYFRLDVERINIPPLRERKEDIPQLVDFFIARQNTGQKKDILGVSNEVMDEWMNYNWPGNVRELQNTIFRAVSLTRDRIISESHLGDSASRPAEPITASPRGALPNLKDAVTELERAVIEKALRESSGNLSQAAQMIGLTRRELQGRIEKYEIEHA